MVNKSVPHDVCRRVRDGMYTMRPVEESDESALFAVVDHYQRFVYCDIPKVASTSWLAFFTKLAERDKEERFKWYETHVLPTYEYRTVDRYR